MDESEIALSLLGVYHFSRETSELHWTMCEYNNLKPFIFNYSVYMFDHSRI